MEFFEALLIAPAVVFLLEKTGIIKKPKAKTSAKEPPLETKSI
jgi:hypothetical protein